MSARVASAAETAACELAAIESGTPAADLMRRAGSGAASVIALRHEQAARKGVLVYAGTGNNGGDGWVVAEDLAKMQFPVRVIALGAPRSQEAIAARDAAMRVSAVKIGGQPDGEQLVVDALLGTGSSGAPRGLHADAIQRINDIRETGATIVSLDLPSGLDATTGAHEGSVCADSTISFGVLKRGHLVARDVCGEIRLVDIGLGASGPVESLPLLVDTAWAHARIPRIPAAAHKGTRKTLAIIGAGKGMAGAAILAGEGALRSGIGLLRIVCAEESRVSVHAGIPAAIVHAWPANPEELAALVSSVDCIAIGPGLGRTSATRDLVERVLLAWSGPVVLDADALNVFAGDVGSLSQLLRGRPAILTPHPAEMARLIGTDTTHVLAARFEIGRDLAQEIGAAVLLKGSPTVISSHLQTRYVVASGTAALATGGSGDVLTGISATLLAQMDHGEDIAAEAGACAAFIHGRAAELCRFVRGTTLDDVLRQLPFAWNERPRPLAKGVLAALESHS